ncbi:PQQ-binding-like beta-propeller repeat protein [Kitasatospora sp. NPDC056327]|uniref:outer membrane protein assembly factor BamB family protein n=1 Tax=Kitasatospora sp. NPDC056327 TaxID=3345785 RepID=UPI0035E1DE09
MGHRVSAWRPVLAGLGGALVAAAAVGLAPGRGGGCERGSGLCPPGAEVLPPAGFAGLVLGAVLLVAAFLAKGPRTTRVVAAGLCAALALPGSWVALDRTPAGPAVVRPAWSAPADQPAGTRAVAVWQDAGTVVRVRADRFDAYRARSGEQAWTLDAPPRLAVCAASPTPFDGVAAVAYGRSAGPCEQLAAVDLRTGRELWRREGVRSSVVELAGPGTVVVLDGERLAAFALRDGTPVWTAAPTAGCRFRALAASAARVAAVEYCVPPGTEANAGSTWLRAFDPAGGVLWRTDLRAASEPARLDVLAADPPVVHLAESDARGIQAVLSFGAADGVLRATVPVSSPDYQLSLNRRLFRFTPVRPAAVAGDLLVAAATRPGEGDSRAVVAHSLADGSRVWARRLEGEVRAVAGTPDGPIVAVEPGRDPGVVVHRLNRADGRSAERTGLRGANLSYAFWLGRADDRYVIVHEDGTGATAPLLGAPRR